MKSPALYSAHILKALAWIDEYARPHLAIIESDELRRPGLERYMETLADSTKHLPEEIKARYPQIPWKRISDFRNRLAHGYNELDFQKVIAVVNHDLATLQAVIEEIHEELLRLYPPDQDD